MGLKTTYNPDKDIPDLDGKVILITGGTTGLGRQTILNLAKHGPAHVFFTGRSAEAADETINLAKSISSTSEFTFLSCDQTSLSSVQSAAKQLLARTDRLDILICNAGIMGGPPGLSKDGFEIQFAINYLAHALLVKLLMPTLEHTASEHGDGRVVLLSSNGFKLPPKQGIVLDELKTTQENLGMGSKWIRYGQSKLAMVLYGKHLAKQYPNLTVLSLHPGVIHTGLFGNLPLGDRLFVKATTLGQDISLEEGTYNACWAATAAKTAGMHSGGIYEPVGKPIADTKLSSDEKLEKALWDWTVEHLAAYDQVLAYPHQAGPTTCVTSEEAI